MDIGWTEDYFRRWINFRSTIIHNRRRVKKDFDARKWVVGAEKHALFILASSPLHKTSTTPQLRKTTTTGWRTDLVSHPGDEITLGGPGWHP